MIDKIFKFCLFFVFCCGFNYIVWIVYGLGKGYFSSFGYVGLKYIWGKKKWRREREEKKEFY